METYRSACNSTYLVKLTLEVGLVANWWRMTCLEGHFSSRLKISLAGVKNTQHVRIHHLLYTNIAPENWWLEYDFPTYWGGLFSGAFAVSFREGNPQSIALDSSLVQSRRICLAGHASFHGNHSNSFDLGGSLRWQNFGKNDGYMEHHPYPCDFFFGVEPLVPGFFVLNMIFRTMLLDCCSCCSTYLSLR